MSKLTLSYMNFRAKVPPVNLNVLMRECKEIQWRVMNEATSPFLASWIKVKNEKNEVKDVYVCIWYTGRITINGVRSEKEARTIYRKIVKELKELKIIKVKKSGSRRI